MGSSKRSLIIFFIMGIGLVCAIGMAIGPARAWSAAGPASGDAGEPRIISSQTPHLQDFFAGEDAVFEVSITNSGAVAFQTVTASNATIADCNRNDLGALAPGESLSFTCSAQNVVESFLNEIQVNGTTDATTVSHTSNSFVKVLKPELRITKTPKSQTVVNGATAYFTVTIFNTSDFVMKIENVDDSQIDNCDRTPTIVTIYLNAGDSLDYSCLAANVQAPLASVITVRGTNPIDNKEYKASDVAWVDVNALEAEMTAQPTTIAEPGGLVTYTVDLVNSGSVPVTLVALTTNQFGSILDPGNPKVEAADNTCLPKPLPPTLAPFGGTFSCSFVASVEGQPSNFSTILTATAEDENGLDAIVTTSASVTITDEPASMSLTLGADPAFINPPSRNVRFSISVENTSAADAITITELNDEFLGNLNGRGTCAVPIADISPGFSYQCSFSALVSGSVGQQKSRLITVKAIDDDLVPKTLTESKTVTVGITDQPTRYTFMPNVSDNTMNRTSCGRPYPLAINRQYFFLPPNTYNNSVPVDQRDQHYFVFELTQTGQVTVELTNFVPQKGQLIVRPHVSGGTPPCGSPALGANPDSSLTKVINLGTRQTGRYYIQLINDGPSNVGQLYGLIVRVQ